MDARRTPEWVGTTHGMDQIPDFRRDRGPSGSSGSNLPGPKQAEAFAVPRDDSLGFDDDQSGSPIGPDSGQPSPKHTVQYGQLRPLLGGTPEHTDLMPQGQDLHLEAGARAE